MKNRLLILSLHLATFYVVLAALEHFVAPIYFYEGYVWTPNEAKWYGAVALVMLLSLITPITSSKPSTLFYQLSLLFVLIPMLALFYGQDGPWEYTLQVCAAYSVSVFLVYFLRIRPPSLHLVSKEKLQTILFLVACAYIASIFMLGGGKYLNFDLSRVYDFRGDASSNLPGFYGYISPLIGKVVVPIGFVLALIHRKYLMAFLFMGCAVLIFGLTAHKSTLFAPFLIFFVYAVSEKKQISLKLNAAILIVLVIALADFWMYEKYGDSVFGWVGNLIMRRSFMVPAHINYMYYDFFSQNNFVLFSNSKLTLGMLEYEYPLDVAHLIGSIYHNDERISANTGWLGSGYMQGGFIVLLIYAAVIAAIFGYIDACARAAGNRALITASVAVPILALITSADLPTAFLTHGLYVNLLLIACFHERNASNAYRPFKQRAFA